MQTQLNNLIKTPSLCYKLPNSFFNLIDFTPVVHLIHKESSLKIFEFDSEVKFTASQHKKFIFHYFIHYTCEVLKNFNNKNKPVIYFDQSPELNRNYYPFLLSFAKKFPVLTLYRDQSMSYFIENLSDGLSEELNVFLYNRLKKNQLKPFYFNKLHYFCKKYELTFLDKTYFIDIKNKLSLL